MSCEDVEVCEEWLNYQNFAAWYANNSFDKGSLYQLDKDLLGCSRTYSPATCCLLKDNINQMLVESGKGYTYRDGVWLVTCFKDYLSVSSELVAKDVVLSYKINKFYGIIRCVERQTQKDGRIVPALWKKVFGWQEEQLNLRKEMIEFYFKDHTVKIYKL